MRVVHVSEVRGRGLCAVVEDKPKQGLLPGVWVHQGDSAWQIKAVEKGSFPQDRCSLVLKPVMGSGQLQEGPAFL